MGEVLNLDALRAPSRRVRFLGVEFELGYIPSGASIPLVDAYNGLLERQELEMAKLGLPKAEAEQVYRARNAHEIEQMNVQFVAQFCSFWDPSITPDRVAKEATVTMVDGFFTEIIRAILTNAARAKVPKASADPDAKKNETGPRL